MPFDIYQLYLVSKDLKRILGLYLAQSLWYIRCLLEDYLCIRSKHDPEKVKL